MFSSCFFEILKNGLVQEPIPQPWKLLTFHRCASKNLHSSKFWAETGIPAM